MDRSVRRASSEGGGDASPYDRVMNDNITSSPKLLTGTGRLILACFILSGFSSLIYEVVWTRMMVLIFGATTLAISTVLTVFMGGLALGSLVFGRTVKRWGNPLLVYALLEVVIGVYGLFIPWILPYLVPVYQMVWEVFHYNFYVFCLLRFVLVGAILLVPTTLMGATLPVLSQLFSKRSNEAGRSLGMLYGFNTVGAVAGSFSTGFIFLPSLGVEHSTWVAVLANFLVGALAILSWKIGGVSERTLTIIREDDVDTAPHIIPGFQLTHRTAAIVLITFALSGFSAMVYEVTWSRTLSLILGSTIYAFSAMLTTFLVGLALGSLISAFIVQRLTRPLFALGSLQIAIGVSAFATLSLMGQLPYLFVAFYKDGLPSISWLPILWFGISFLTMLLPTLFLGALFPLVVRLLQGYVQEIGKLAGDVYSVNTLGAILGSFSAGFILIPVIGIQLSVLSALYLNLVLGVTLLLMHYSLQNNYSGAAGSLKMPRWSLVSVILALGILMAFIKPTWDSRIMTSGVFLHLPEHVERLNKQGRQGFNESLSKDREVLFYKEGIAATVMVEKDPEFGVSLIINGRREAGDKFLRTEVLLAHLPFLLSPQSNPEQALIIGWGSGATAGSVTQFPVKRVVAVELETAILEATRFFDQSNHQPLNDPRVEVVVNDGRNYLLATPEKFDVIISQPSLPWIAGASNLFTEEFFRLGAARLNEGGIFCQWLSETAISAEDVQSVVKSFSAAFRTVWIFRTVPGDIILLGSTQEPGIDPDRIKALLSRPQISADLNRIGILDPYDLMSLYLFGSGQVESFTAKAVANTDDNAYIELFGPMHYYVASSQGNNTGIDQKILLHVAQEIESGTHPLMRLPNTDPSQALLDVAQVHLKNNQNPWALLFVNESLKIGDTARGHYMRGQLLESLASYMGLTRPEDKKSRDQIIVQAIREFQTALQGRPTPQVAQLTRFELGAIFLKMGLMDEAAAHYEAILKEDPTSYEANANLGAIHLQKGNLSEALREYQKAIKTHPQDPEVLFKLGLIYSRQAQYEPAIKYYQEALENAPDHLDAHFNLARVYELTHHPEKALEHYTRFLELAPQVKDYAVEREVVQVKLRQLAGTGGR